MVQSTNVSYITSDTTLSDLFDFYIVEATGASINITLPTITSDGMNFQLSREDTTNNIVTISTSDTDIIHLSNGSTGSSTTLVADASFQSYQGAWYIMFNNANAKPIFSMGYFTANSSSTLTNSFVRVSATNTRVAVSQFPYKGSLVDRITSASVVMSNTSTTGTTGIIDIRDDITQVVYGTAAFTLGVTAATVTVNIENFTGLPATPTILEFGVNPKNATARLINLHALTVQ